MTTIGKILVGSGFTFMMIGMFFKILHWPDANEIIAAGTFLTITSVWVILFSSKNK